MTAPELVDPIAVVPVDFVGRWSACGLDVVVGETEADHGADVAAVCCGGRQLLARIGHVSCCVEAWYGRCPGGVGLHELSEPTRVHRWLETERYERSEEHPEAGTDHYRVGVDALAISQFDRRDVTVGTRDDAAHCPVHDIYATGS